MILGAALVFTGAILFSTKAVIVKLAYRYEVDSISLLALRMLFSLPFFLLVAALSGRQKEYRGFPISRKDGFRILFLGVVGYYLASMLDFLGLQYVTASLERLILFVYPTLVLLIGATVYREPVTRRQLGSIGPISTIVLAYIFLGERLGWLQWAGTVLVIAGVLLITLQKRPKTGS